MTGDVAGHGLPAAVVMGRLRSTMRAYALLGRSCEEVLALTNRKLLHFEFGETATVLCATSPPPYDEFPLLGRSSPTHHRPSDGTEPTRRCGPGSAPGRPDRVAADADHGRSSARLGAGALHRRPYRTPRRGHRRRYPPPVRRHPPRPPTGRVPAGHATLIGTTPPGRRRRPGRVAAPGTPDPAGQSVGRAVCRAPWEPRSGRAGRWPGTTARGVVDPVAPVARGVPPARSRRRSRAVVPSWPRTAPGECPLATLRAAGGRGAPVMLASRPPAGRVGGRRGAGPVLERSALGVDPRGKLRLAHRPPSRRRRLGSRMNSLK